MIARKKFVLLGLLIYIPTHEHTTMDGWMDGWMVH